MTLIAAVATDLGRIELHHEFGQFTTKGTFADALIGTERAVMILQNRDSAQEWYDLARRKGILYRDMPEEEEAPE